MTGRSIFFIFPVGGATLRRVYEVMKQVIEADIRCGDLRWTDHTFRSDRAWFFAYQAANTAYITLRPICYHRNHDCSGSR